MLFLGLCFFGFIVIAVIEQFFLDKYFYNPKAISVPKVIIIMLSMAGLLFSTCYTLANSTEIKVVKKQDIIMANKEKDNNNLLTGLTRAEDDYYYAFNSYNGIRTEKVVANRSIIIKDNTKQPYMEKRILVFPEKEKSSLLYRIFSFPEFITESFEEITTEYVFYIPENSEVSVVTTNK